jgi:FkbM family methyltransferase
MREWREYVEGARRRVTLWRWKNAARRPGVPIATFFELVYERAPTDAELAALRHYIGKGRVASPGDARRVLSFFDAQSHPTSFSVRARAEVLQRVDLGDFVLWLDDGDHAVSDKILAERAWEPHISALLAEYLRPGMTFVDVGANVGYHTFLAASLVGASGRVIAVEATAENCRLLLLSKADNEARNVDVLPVFLDRAPGARYLTAHRGTNAGMTSDSRDALLAGTSTIAYATTLDEIRTRKVDVLKVDVEGAEFLVLQGGRKTIENDKPVVIMEFSAEMSQRVSGVEPEAALQEILDVGYQLNVIDGETGQPAPFASAAALLASWNDPYRIEDLLLLPR